VFFSIKCSPNLLSKELKNSSPQAGVKVITSSKSTITFSLFLTFFRDGSKAAKDFLPNCRLVRVVPNFFKKIVISSRLKFNQYLDNIRICLLKNFI